MSMSLGSKQVVQLLCILLLMGLSIALPMGVNLNVLDVEQAPTTPAEAHTAAGGSFTTLILNVTSQTSKWKAYIGNVSGKITLDNAESRTIYDWHMASMQGEVYVSRNDSVDFSRLICANEANISHEEGLLNISWSSEDSINGTFTQKMHRSFVIGNMGVVANNSCFAIATYINDSAQVLNENSHFQEVLLSDSSNLVYVSLLENKESGFDNQTKDFQMIVPDNPTEVSNMYYFYAELG